MDYYITGYKVKHNLSGSKRKKLLTLCVNLREGIFLTASKVMGLDYETVSAKGESLRYFGRESIVTWHDIDNKQLLRPVAFMNIAQELANTQATALKFGYYELISANQVWVLSRIKMRFYNLPKWGDKIMMYTWHKGARSLFWLRDFAMYKVASRQELSTDLTPLAVPELCAVCASYWVIINTQTRRMERTSVINNNELAMSYAGRVDVLNEECGKLAVPDGAVMECVAKHVVGYSDVDFNRHANNAKYIEWIMDILPHSLSLERVLRSVQINYIAEAKLDDNIYFMVDMSAVRCVGEGCCSAGGAGSANDCCNKTLYVEGRKGAADGVLVFQAELEF